MEEFQNNRNKSNLNTDKFTPDEPNNPSNSQQRSHQQNTQFSETQNTSETTEKLEENINSPQTPQMQMPAEMRPEHFQQEKSGPEMPFENASSPKEENPHHNLTANTAQSREQQISQQDVHQGAYDDDFHNSYTLKNEANHSAESFNPQMTQMPPGDITGQSSVESLQNYNQGLMAEGNFMEMGQNYSHPNFASEQEHNSLMHGISPADYTAMNAGTMFPDSESMMPAGINPSMGNINNFNYNDFAKMSSPETTQSMFPISFPMNFPSSENSNYDMSQMYQSPEQILPNGMPLAYSDINSIMPQSDYGQMQSIPDNKLRPSCLTNEELRRELIARDLPYNEDDKISNIARLVNYLVDNNYGESDLSSHPEEEDIYTPPTTPSTSQKRVYTFLEVILINCDNQRKPLLDWLETWKNASKDVNVVEIFELVENNLIKIRIYNKFNEASGVIDQLNSVKIKCARYYCHSRGEKWGGWEYFEEGFMQKSEKYNNEHQPPFFWKRLCWLENVENSYSEVEKMDVSRLTPEQIGVILGTDEEMICVDCGNFEKTCAEVHGQFNGHFKSKDLYNRYAALIGV